jgi:hypothetical protein
MFTVSAQSPFTARKNKDGKNKCRSEAPLKKSTVSVPATLLTEVSTEVSAKLTLSTDTSQVPSLIIASTNSIALTELNVVTVAVNLSSSPSEIEWVKSRSVSISIEAIP